MDRAASLGDMTARRPIRQGLLFGLLMGVCDAAGVFGSPFARLIADDVVGLLLRSALAWALFAVWLGRGRRTWVAAVATGASGLWIASVVSNAVGATAGVLRGESWAAAWERLGVTAVGVLIGPLVLGAVGALLGWLTRRRDALGAAVKVVLAVGLVGNLAVGFGTELTGSNEVRRVTSSVALLAGFAALVWFAVHDVREGRRIAEADSQPSHSAGEPPPTQVMPVSRENPFSARRWR